MQRLDWSSLSPAARLEALARPKRRSDTQVVDVVRRIFDDVDRGGEAGVRDWALKLDGRAPAVLELS
ncbi:MAG: histidinol dehydrogenase, partial [Hyphomonadaceae bacterium]